MSTEPLRITNVTAGELVTNYAPAPDLAELEERARAAAEAAGIEWGERSSLTSEGT